MKTVVHGLVDFIQNHSKKGADPQQVSVSIKLQIMLGKNKARLLNGLIMFQRLVGDLVMVVQDIVMTLDF